jgi:tetratricopeptide (TPR) repeat protein
MGVIMLVYYLLDFKEAIFFGAITYLLISYILKKLIPRDHRTGVKKTKLEQFEQAIPDFEKSYAFFKKHEWIDKYRIITLLSSSKMSYREMALANIGFCYGQIGNGKQSKAFYEKTLLEFPESGLAKSALKLITAAESNEV